jgi:hypothetical protein
LGFDNRNPLRQETFDLSAHPIPAPAGSFNLYLGYSPSWLPTSDREMSDPVWLAGLNREQRIIMRSYATAHSHAKPPPEDFPLFLERDSGTDREPDRYRDHVRLLHRKRRTAWERSKAASDSGR